MLSSAVLAVTVISWPSTVPQASIDEVNRLIGKRFELEHCVRSETKECPSDALWIQFQVRPAGWKALAVADRKTNTIGVFPDCILEFTKVQHTDVWFKIIIGRIAAHEVTHLLVTDRDHWGSGLMRSHLSRETLTSLRLLPLED